MSVVHLSNTFVRDCASGNGSSAGTRPYVYPMNLTKPGFAVDKSKALRKDLLSFYLQTRPHGNVQVVDLVVNTHSTES